MRVIAKPIIVQFYTQHADAKTALDAWYKKVQHADWNNFMDIKADFNSVDAVGNDRFVFNIKGNHYRIVAMILFIPKRVYIRFIGTHAEYDKITDIENI